MKKLKNINSFLNEGNMDTKDFYFQTNLGDSEISFTNYGNNAEFEDYSDFSAIVNWHIDFEWMGDTGVDYSITVDKVSIEYTGINYGEDDNEITEEKTLIIQDTSQIEIDTDNHNTQITVNEIEVDNGSVNVIF
jgi:hypothetical protein